MIMKAAPYSNRRTTLLGGALCLTALIAFLVGGIVRADAAAHHRSAIAVTAVATGDNHAAPVRLDQPSLLAVAAAALMLAALFGARTRSTGPFLHRLTAGSPAPRGPPRQAL
jgi:hypothetical protein